MANVHSGTRIGTEALLQFYDIFVRNAFGNYRLLLKEVVYSVVMGNMLNYLNSRSLGFRWRQRESAGLGYPDEVRQHKKTTGCVVSFTLLSHLLSLQSSLPCSVFTESCPCHDEAVYYWNVSTQHRWNVQAER